MTAALCAFIGLVTVAALVQTALGANYVVGGAGGWNLGTNLQTWASAQSFKTGDTLTFSYPSLHSVVEVSKADYDACSLSNPINSFTDGNTAVKLSSSGKRYFICGTGGHCSGGMKVAINTVSAAVATPPPAPLVTPPPLPSDAPSISPTEAPVHVTPPALPSDAPFVSPSKAPARAPSTSDSPSSTPVVTPTASPSATPVSDFPETAPTPQASGANFFSPLAKVGLGLAANMLMALVP